MLGFEPHSVNAAQAAVQALFRERRVIVAVGGQERTPMQRKLRSNLEPGTALWAGRRAQWRALGLSDEDMAKPKIAIVNSSSELSS
jgi:dihydroxyacid dehydratase/phosphogluconate dehydratase